MAKPPNTNSPSELSRETQRKPLSIALLFYLVTLAAIVAASLRHLPNDDAITVEALIAALVAGGIIGLGFGLAAGITYFKSGTATTIAMASGILIGCAAGAVALIRAEHFIANMSIAFGGCWIVILMMLTTARFQASVD